MATHTGKIRSSCLKEPREELTLLEKTKLNFQILNYELSRSAFPPAPVGKKYHYGCNKTMNVNRDEPIFYEDRKDWEEKESELEEEEEVAKYDKCVR